MSTLTTCPSWCTEEHLETGIHANPRADGCHTSSDMPMDFLFDDGTWAQWNISTNGEPPPVAYWNIDITSGLPAVDLRDYANALLKVADEMDRITGL